MIEYEQEYLNLVLSYFSHDFNPVLLPETERKLFDISHDAFESYIYARMSELPIENEISAFTNKVLAAETRELAYRAATDRGDPNALAVLNAAGKVTIETHRMMGLLRFSPQEETFTARCAPDHFVLPTIGEFFTARFADIPWAIIDEKRRLKMGCSKGEKLKLEPLTQQESASSVTEGADEWEKLWQHYHKTINNESRSNPNLQRRFMPKRYWNYLSEKN
jgi:probable DNA metabolism protein